MIAEGRVQDRSIAGSRRAARDRQGTSEGPGGTERDEEETTWDAEGPRSKEDVSLLAAI